MIPMSASAVPAALNHSKDRARRELFLQVVPASLDPICTPIPPEVCAFVLDITRDEHDLLLACGTVEQSCEVSPFGGLGLWNPLMMSNYWDLVRTAIVLRFCAGNNEMRYLIDRLSAVIDEVAITAEDSERTGLVAADSLFNACQALEEHARGLALFAVFTMQDLPRRFVALGAVIDASTGPRTS